MMRALLLSLALTAGAPVALAAEPSATSEVDRARELARDGHTDEAVSLLLREVQQPDSGAAAAAELRNLLLTAPPRRAWAAAYGVAQEGADDDTRHALQVRAARADLQDAASRDAALRRLQGLLQARPDDAELRVFTGEALVDAGRFEVALRVVGNREGAAMRKVRVAALIGLDRLDEAKRVEGARVPSACAQAGTPAACASGLEEMGYRGGAAASLRRALRSGHPALRTRDAKASAWARVGTIEAVRGELVLAIQAWREAHRLDPDNRVYKDRLSQLLAGAGRVDEAADVVGEDDPKLRDTIRAVRLVSSVDPEDDSPEVKEAIAEARALDPDHPRVVQASAHYLIAHGNADTALRLLEPAVRTGSATPDMVDLYIWAATEAGEVEKATAAVEASLSSVDDPDRWARRSAQLATLYTQAAEAAKARGDLDQAVVLYERARASDPASIRVLVGLGGVLWKRGDEGRAIAVYRRALREAPGNRTALFSVVELLRLDEREGAARELLRESGYDDLKVRELEAQLAVMQAAKTARDLRKRGELDASVAEYQRLMREHPDQPALLHAAADTMLEAGRPVEAAETYARAAALDPDNPYLTLGEITALVALQQPEEARLLLRRLPQNPEDEALARAIRRARWSVERVEAERLVREGREDAALELLQRWTDEAEDAEAGVAIGDLYLSRWQHGAAAAWYRWSLEQDPDLAAAHRGLVRADLARGDTDAAEARATELVDRDPTPENVALAQQVARRGLLDAAISAAADGDHARAERLLLDQIRTHPDDLDLRVAHARLLLLRGEPRSALREAQAVLIQEPTHPGALSAVQTAALELDQADVALAAYEVALGESGALWIRDEVQTLRLAARLDKARETYARGQTTAAVTIVGQATEYYGDDSPRRWALIGGAWLDIKRPERARMAFEMARRNDPADPGAVIGLAAARETLGQGARAESLLTAHWETYHHPAVGVALVELQRRRDRDDAARRTLRALRADATADDRLVAADAPPPTALPEVAPEGQTIDQSGVGRDPDAPSWSTVQLADLDEEDESTVLQATLGGGWVGRPGDAGQQFLNILHLPLAVSADLPGPIDLSAEVVGVRLTDGARDVSGASMSAALTTGLPGPWSAQARLGRDQVATEGFQPMTTWFLGADGRVTAGLVAEVQAGKAPVTDTLTSWAGSYDATGAQVGRAFDTWAGAGLSYGWSSGSTLGALGRVGHADDNDPAGAMGQVPWRQLLAYGRTPLQVDERRTTYAGFEGIVLDHDRQVDGFTSGQGGMFTPDLFATAIARLEMVTTSQDGRWTACGLAGAGPQVVQGEQTLFLFPGTYLGYQVQGTAQLDLGSHFWLTGHAMHAGTFGAWGQSAVFGQLRYGSPATLTSPSPILGSLVHGPPLTGPAQCPEPRQEVSR